MTAFTNTPLTPTPRLPRRKGEYGLPAPSYTILIILFFDISDCLFCLYFSVVIVVPFFFRDFDSEDAKKGCHFQCHRSLFLM